ncbi:MAG TPA: rhodanese-like domain-containing protein, partial [Burkholderiales bacterium]|nr:rhodanese-like domain-containing protein [Burkholderiales bacterium]
AKARAAAGRVAQRFDVRFASRAQVQSWQGDLSRTLYLLDVRTREEFEARRLAGSRHAPGGQLVQATDEYVGVRNARIILVDPARVRSVMTASWLVQMGWSEVHVLEPEGEDGFAGWPTESGASPAPIERVKAWPETSSAEKNATVIDFSTSLRFRSYHIPGAWWAVRARLAEARAKIGEVPQIVLTSEDSALAHLAAPEVAALWPQASVKVLRGGNASYRAADYVGEEGLERATTAPDDVWYKPYDHADKETHARAYLEWEVALVERIRREPGIRFREF